MDGRGPDTRRRPERILRVGIIGAGLMGHSHGVVARRLGADVVAIVDVDPQAATQFGRRYPRARVFTSVEDMLDAACPDAVHICAPPDSHVSLAMTLIRQGVHVLVEKPFAPSLADTKKLLDAADATKVIACPVHQFVFQDGVLRARERLSALGDVARIRCTIYSAGGVGAARTAQDAIVADILPHPLSLLRTLWPERPFVVDEWHILHPRPGELLVGGDLAGSVFDLAISLAARPTRCEFDILGEAGSIHLDLFHGYAMVEAGKVSRLRKISRPFAVSSKTLNAAGGNLLRRIVRREFAYPGLYQLTNRFYSAVRGRQPSPIPAPHTLDVAMARDKLLAKMNSETVASGALTD